MAGLSWHLFTFTSIQIPAVQHSPTLDYSPKEVATSFAHHSPQSDFPEHSPN